MLESAYIKTRKVPHFDMPWETSFSKRVLGKEPIVPKPLQGLASTWVGFDPAAFSVDPSGTDSSDVVDGHSDAPFYLKSLMAISDNSFHEQKEEQLSNAVEKWLSILRLHPDSSDTGRLLLGDESPEDCKLEARRTIAATLGVKSKTTAISRANAFLRFVNWRETALDKPDHAPICESDVWAYLCFLQDSGAAPTRPQGLLSALNYMRFVFGYECFQGICCSKRLTGLADVMFAGKRALKQSKLLTVEQVLWIHGQLESDQTHPNDGPSLHTL